VGATAAVLTDDPPPPVEPAPAVASPAVDAAVPQLSVAEEVALLHASTARTRPAPTAGAVTTVPTIVDNCLSQNPC
jgi:hypothetical protein